MPLINPAITQWIRQMADSDQAVACHAYQCLQEEVFHVSRPGEEAAQTALATALGEALVAQAKPGPGARSRRAASSRNNLARLLSYLPLEAAAPYLARALNDLEVREMARQALESNPSERATGALLTALDAAGPAFCAGVINSLAKRTGERVAAALRRAAQDRQFQVRMAALLALADFPEPSHDAILEKAAKAASARERRMAHRARARLAETLRATGNQPAAHRICNAILSSHAPEPQKKAARPALRMS